MGNARRLHESARLQHAARARALDAANPIPVVTAAPSPLVPLQQSIGNRAVGQLVQAKLRVGSPGDQFEREADRVADQVMRMPASAATAPVAAPRTSRKCAECGKEEKLQRKPAGSEPTAEAPASVYEVLRLPGQPLDSAALAFMETRFGQDFSQVRVHTDRDAAESSRFMNAVAYTVGRDIVFGHGQYAPHTEPGRRLIAHELSHVVQQHAMRPATNGPGFVLQRHVVDPRALHTETDSSPRHIRISEWLVESMAGGGTSRTELYWVDFEVDAKDVMRASVRTVGPDRAYRSPNLRFGDQFRAALQHFSANGVAVNAFEGDWSYMTKDEISENLRVFREGMAAGKTREQAARATPSGRVAAGSSFELTSVENVPESQEHLAEEGVRRWRVKAVFRRIPAPPKPPAGGTPTTPTQQGASGGSTPTMTPSKSASPTVLGTEAGPGPKHVKDMRQAGVRKPSAVSARDMAAEIARTLRDVQRLEKMTRFAYWGLGTWQAVNALLDVAKSVNMATAILAQGSPFAAQIRDADTIESTAKEIAQHYGSFDLLGLRMSDQYQSWSSFYDVSQAQLMFLSMEDSFHQALKEVQAARDNIEDQINALRDEMATRAAATIFPSTSLVYAEVMLFADAGGKINARLLAASKHYAMAKNSLQSHIGMTRALAQRHEMRLRELGTSGVFWKIPTHKVRSTDLDKFTFRR